MLRPAGVWPIITAENFKWEAGTHPPNMLCRCNTLLLQLDPARDLVCAVNGTQHHVLFRAPFEYLVQSSL